jgi:hypothetical protein
MRLVNQYTDVPAFRPEIVKEFIYKVIVHQAEKLDGHRRQQVEIIYNCVGAVILPNS